jgi:micrococcal nuclease
LYDRYGRLLAHVILKNGGYLNGMLVRNGFARVEVVSPNKVQAAYFYSLQEEAIRGKVGMWSLPPDKQPFIEDSEGDYEPRYRIEKKAS